MKAKEGFPDPVYCPRGRTDCASLAQIIGQDYKRVEATPVGKGINSDIEVPLCISSK